MVGVGTLSNVTVGDGVAASFGVGVCPVEVGDRADVGKGAVSVVGVGGRVAVGSGAPQAVRRRTTETTDDNTSLSRTTIRPYDQSLHNLHVPRVSPASVYVSGVPLVR